MRGALSASVCAYLSRPTRALVCAGMQLPALEQRFTHTARIQASSTPMFLRARISKMLSIWALVASKPTRPWHPYGHRWSHGPKPVARRSAYESMRSILARVHWYVSRASWCTVRGAPAADKGSLAAVPREFGQSPNAPSPACAGTSHPGTHINALTQACVSVRARCSGCVLAVAMDAAIAHYHPLSAGATEVDRALNQGSNWTELEGASAI